eukprot:COSAG05_NODE_939_length_6517_cov_2.480524_4_plen_225_part_00
MMIQDSTAELSCVQMFCLLDHCGCVIACVVACVRAGEHWRRHWQARKALSRQPQLAPLIMFSARGSGGATAVSSPTTILRQFLEGGDEDDVDERYLSALMMKASDRNVSASRRSTTATVPGLSQQHHYDGVIDDAYDVDAIDQPELLSARRRQHEHHGAMSSAHEPEMKHIFLRLSELEDSLHPVRSGAPRTVSNMEGPHDHSNYQLQLERAFQERDEAQHTVL